MSSAQSIPASPNMPATDVPSHETLEHHAPAPFDPQMIAQMANAFFQLQPHQVPPAPIAPGVPVAAPLAPDIPAPSVVTTVAPYAPARPSYGPPDIPPTTIPFGGPDAECRGAGRAEQRPARLASARHARSAAARRFRRRAGSRRSERDRLCVDPATLRRSPRARLAGRRRAAARSRLGADSGGIGAVARRQSLFPARALLFRRAGNRSLLASDTGAF